MRPKPVASRRATLTTLAVVAGSIAVCAIVAVIVFARSFGSTPEGASVDVAAGDASCGQAAGRWVQVWTDRSAAPDQWATELATRTAPEAVQTLSGVDRSATPTGGVTRVRVASDAVSCDARVHTGDGAVTALTLTVRDGAWLVTWWGQQSTESG